MSTFNRAICINNNISLEYSTEYSQGECRKSMLWTNRERKF